MIDARHPPREHCDDVERPALSLVFPVFEEEANLGPLIRNALQIAARLADDFEIVLVDDGSGDGIDEPLGN